MFFCIKYWQSDIFVLYICDYMYFVSFAYLFIHTVWIAPSHVGQDIHGFLGYQLFDAWTITCFPLKKNNMYILHLP